MNFVAPVKDMLFNIRHLAEIEQMVNWAGFEDVNIETAQAILEESAKFTEEIISPLNRSGDAQPSSLNNGIVTASVGFKEAYRKYIEGGWPSLQHPIYFGGQGLPKLIGSACSEMLNSANMSFADRKSVV